jgi:hypothetical protein
MYADELVRRRDEVWIGTKMIDHRARTPNARGMSTRSAKVHDNSNAVFEYCT